MYKDVLDKLIQYLEREQYKGLDPYDTLNSPFILKMFGTWFSVLSIQFQKRNPINIRPLLGIKKEYNPKAMGLFLSAYSRLYKITNDNSFLEKAKFFFTWLQENYSEGYSGYAWGYNFPWAGPGKYLEKNSPTSVVTGFVSTGIFDYYSITGDTTALDILKSSCDFLEKDIIQSSYNRNLCFSYTTEKADNCYNASLLAAETFAKTYSLTRIEKYKTLSVKALNYVLEKQLADGRWNYSIDEESGVEREQIDFHQGYILISIYKIYKYCELKDPHIEESIRKGLKFYKKNQFNTNGSSLWRYPREFPVDIHNQAQGIITFSYLKEYLEESEDFVKIISDWTFNNMFNPKGYFYYRKYRLFKNKIPYMRWSQAWMLLALTYTLEE